MIEKSVPATIFSCTKFLLQKFAGRSEEEQQALITTMYACAQFHGSQKRLSGQPFIIHPLEVACLLAATGTDLPTVQAGLLHDVLEDTKTTPDEIIRQFGNEVYSLVDAATRFKMFSHKEFLEKVYAKSKRDSRIASIKLADQISNHRHDSQMIFSPQKHLEHVQEHKEFYIGKITDIPDVPKDLILAFNRVHQSSYELYHKRKK